MLFWYLLLLKPELLSSSLLALIELSMFNLSIRSLSKESSNDIIFSTFFILLFCGFLELFDFFFIIDLSLSTFLKSRRDFCCRGDTFVAFDFLELLLWLNILLVLIKADCLDSYLLWKLCLD